MISSVDRPNILLIMTDQQRFDSLGCTGCASAHTPNLDALAAEGALFERCYTTNPICTPARASLMTGKYVPGHGVYRLYDDLPRDEVLFTEHLQREGYETALFGKLHVCGKNTEGKARHPHDGFDTYEWCLEGSMQMDSPFNGYRKWLEKKNPEFCRRLEREKRRVLHIPRELHMTRWAAERTIDFIDSRSGDLPFFCKMSVFDPHDPYKDYPEECGKLIDEDRIAEPVGAEGDETSVPEAVRREREHSYLGAFRKFSRDEIRDIRLGYHASLALIDAEVGRVLEILERKGLAQNTLVIFASDHGDMLGDHGLMVKGAFFYDPCVRVPLLMRWPARLAGRKRVESLVQLHDLSATILAAAGFAEDDIRRYAPDAESLLHLADGSRKTVRNHAVCCYRNTGICDAGAYWDPPIHATMFRDDRYKMNVYHDPDGAGVAGGQLFDMDRDPLELNDLWDEPEHAQVRMRLGERMIDWFFKQELRFGSRGGGETPTPKTVCQNALK